MKEKLTEKEQDVLFDLAYGRFDYNEETADTYNGLKESNIMGGKNGKLKTNKPYR